MDRRTVLKAIGGLPLLAGTGIGSTEAASGGLEVDVVAENLVVPWGAAFRGEALYVTERPGYLTEITETGYDRVADFTDETAEYHDSDAPEDATSGLCGLAFHPTDAVAYLYQSYGPKGSVANRILTYDLETGERDVLFDGIGGSYWQDGGRLLVANDALYVTTGQGQYWGNPNPAARDPSTLVGKTLRLTLDGDPHPDNPFGNAVYTLGHRNPEGLAVRHGGRLFATEHGPSHDDEINVLRKGDDYGWPKVMGESDTAAITDPIVSYTPTVAIAGAAFYYGENPNWNDDLFFATLKDQTLYRVHLSEGTPPQRLGQTTLLSGEYGRLRTVFTGPDGHLYVTTSNRDQNGYAGAAENSDLVLRVRQTRTGPADRHTLVVDGNGPESTYEFAVSGEVLGGTDLAGDDSYAGSSGSGTVHGWRDGYTFTGSLEQLSVTGGATALLDGTEIDPADYGATRHRLVIDGNGPRSTYEFTVSGEILGGTDLAGDDSYTGSSGSGTVYGWRDGYTFTGSLETITVEGDADVYLDGRPY